MRWPVKPETPRPELGDLRVREMFAWWPRRIGNEWVWGEAYYREEEWAFQCGGWDWPSYYYWRYVREWVLD